jgi:predicted DNA-binding protein
MRTTTTSLKLPTKLKERIASLAKSSGKTPHAWMIEALERQAELAELREKFLYEALDSAAEVDSGGPLYAAEEVHAYIRARAAGRPVKKPRPIKRDREH